MEIQTQSEPRIEVHKFYGGAIAVTVFLALVLQAFLHRYTITSELLELPLLVTIYFGLSRRNPSSGLLLGMVIGLLQDGTSPRPAPIGLYGIAKTLVGYLASSIGVRVDVEHPFARAGLVFVFFHVQQAVLAVIKRLLLEQTAPFFSSRLLVASLMNAVLALLVFPLLDKLRKPQ